MIRLTIEQALLAYFLITLLLLGGTILWIQRRTGISPQLPPPTQVAHRCEFCRTSYWVDPTLFTHRCPHCSLWNHLDPS